MTDGVLVVFRLPDGTPVEVHRRFRKRIYGEATSSWEGRYQYRRRGLLDEVPHVLLYTGVVIVREQDEGRLVRAVREYEAQVTRRRVELIASDIRALGLRSR